MSYYFQNWNETKHQHIMQKSPVFPLLVNFVNRHVTIHKTYCVTLKLMFLLMSNATEDTGMCTCVYSWCGYVHACIRVYKCLYINHYIVFV